MPEVGRRVRYTVLRLAFAVFFWVSVLILKIARPGSSWHYVPFFMCAVGGCYWVLTWTWELASEWRETRTIRHYTLFYSFFYVPFSYALLVLVFAMGYLAASHVGGQVLCVKDNYQCVTEFRSLLYYSMVTASTLGYGDLIPVGLARLLASVEIVTFWFFLAGGFLCFERATKPSPRWGS